MHCMRTVHGSAPSKNELFKSITSTLTKMKELIFLVACFLLLEPPTHGQGAFIFDNRTAPTRIGTIDGPLAGTNIWGQMLVGQSRGSLAPVGMSVAHALGGIQFAGVVLGGNVEVPGLLPCQSAYVEMVAWDARLWGTSLAGVPADQLGMTDTVPIRLGGPIPCDPIPIPIFRQPAVVPVPEPAGLEVGALVGLVLVLVCGVRNRAGPLAGAQPLGGTNERVQSLRRSPM